MEYTRIGYEVRDRHATITLRRADKRNSLDDVMVAELTAAFSAAAKDPAVKVVSLKGDGPAFCAGADLAYVQRVAKFDLEENRVDSQRLAALYRLIYEIRKPVIAVVHGPALAGGCGLASVCDFILASEEHARFGYTEARIGFVPAVVMVFLIKRIGEGRARELVVRGNIIDATEAWHAGLVTKVVAHDALGRAEEELAAELLTMNSGTSMGLCKEILARLDGMNFQDGLEFSANMNAAARMTQDCKLGIEAFLAKKPMTW